MTLQRSAAVVVSLLISLTAAAQTPTVEPGNKVPDRTPVPTITFTVDWPGGAKPQHYSLKIELSGRVTYISPDDAKDAGDPYTAEFTLSRGVRERIFAAAGELNYFKGNFDFTKHRIAFTGTKRLRYSDSDRSFETTYNWSENANLTDLTRRLQAIAATLAWGQRLQHDERFDRLSLNSDLKSMEDSATNRQVAELHSIEPLLRQIADNPNVMDLARQRARHLLRLASEESGAPAPH